MMSSSVARVLSERVREVEQARISLHRLAGDLLSTSKRSMFAWHRGDETGAERELSLARTIFDDARQVVEAEARLLADGPWRAAQEEFAEAWLFAEYLRTGSISLPPVEDPELVLGALSDVIGELARKAVLLATDRKIGEVEKMVNAGQEILGLLLSLDLTGSLRSKTDQARQHVRKLEDIRYDLSLLRG